MSLLGNLRVFREGNLKGLSSFRSLGKAILGKIAPRPGFQAALAFCSNLRVANLHSLSYVLRIGRRPTMLTPRPAEAKSLEDVAPENALRGFFLIMDAWQVKPDEQRILLGALPERTYYAARKGDHVRVPPDMLRRIGYVAGIYKALQILYSDSQLANSWVKRPNKAFGNRTPLDRMKGGDVIDLAAVRSYLDAARAPWS